MVRYIAAQDTFLSSLFPGGPVAEVSENTNDAREENGGTGNGNTDRIGRGAAFGPSDANGFWRRVMARSPIEAGVHPHTNQQMRTGTVTLGPVTVGDVNEIDELERSVDGCGAAQALGAGAGPDPAPPRPPGCRCSPGPSCAPTEGGLLFEGRHPRRPLPPGCAALKSLHRLSL